jgi:hypothetical protein
MHARCRAGLRDRGVRHGGEISSPPYPAMRSAFPQRVRRKRSRGFRASSRRVAGAVVDRLEPVQVYDGQDQDRASFPRRSRSRFAEAIREGTSDCRARSGGRGG